MKKFEIPAHYSSSIIAKIKDKRKNDDPRKKDYSPSVLDFGKVKFFIARHFGFCFGVEHAIEIAYKTVEENGGKRIFLLSEMIHNPAVNADLISRGVKFLMDTKGNQIVDWSDLTKDDIVMIPAFGTTIEIENHLKEIGIDPYRYNTTCPFVEKVWSRAKVIGDKGATVIIHGKFKHEETRATFSHSSENSPSIIIKDIEEAKVLGEMILNEKESIKFYETFKGRFSKNFDFKKHFKCAGVVNQTTMLATETQEIADYFKEVMKQKFGEEHLSGHFIDSRDTLCYATNDNQNATYELMETDADLAIVVGGYNSSNTTHLVELLQDKFPTYFINSDENISGTHIDYFDINRKQTVVKEGFLPDKKEVKIILTSGASCPDSLVDAVIMRLLENFEDVKSIKEVLGKI
ncbi:MAG: 4-hydroxy-3-methylbut-2-enyl diphosphate reductase [Melioribacteraceae bacterium]|nr:4-hydroxy-3-methylbut-2-enyl diphosphate reductase [Melioribacteraceae bacterium]